MRRTNLHTHWNEDISFCCLQAVVVLLISFRVHYRLQMEIAPALSLRINISEEIVTHIHHLNACYGNPWGVQSASHSLSVNHNQCVSSALACSLYYWWPMGLETRQLLGPTRHSCPVLYTHTHKHHHQVMLTLESVYFYDLKCSFWGMSGNCLCSFCIFYHFPPCYSSLWFFCVLFFCVFILTT